MNKINSSFITCGVLSLLGVALSTFTAISLPVAVFVELAPLGWYFSRLLRVARNETLGQTAIDSIYYFGFLITIFSLAASVFHVWLHGVGNDVENLISHFGVGLLATGLALAFRMWLTAVTEQLSKKDLDETIESYIRRVDDVVAKVEMSAASFEGLSESLQQHTEKVVRGASNAFETAMVESTTTFRNKLEQITREGVGAVQLFSTTVKELSLAEHVVGFDRNMMNLTGGLKNVVNQLSISGTEMGENAQKVTAIALNETVVAHAKGLAELTARSKEAMDDILAGVDDLDFADDAGIVREHMQSLSTTVNNITKKFGALEEKIELVVVRQSAETIRLIVEGFASQFKAIATSIEDESLERAQSILTNMARITSEALSSTRESANQQFASQLSTTTAQLSKVTESLNNLGVAEHLGKLADASEDAHLALSESVDEIRTVVQEMQKLELRIASINPVIEIENARANVARLSAAIQECESSARNASGGMFTSRAHSSSDTSTLAGPHLERERAIQPALVPADGT